MTTILLKSNARVEVDLEKSRAVCGCGKAILWGRVGKKRVAVEECGDGGWLKHECLLKGGVK